MHICVLDLILEEKNISVKELSIDTGISESYLYNILNNRKSNISLFKLAKIGKALNMNPKDFFYSVREFEEVQKKMDNLIELNGLNDSKVKFYSKILDRLFVEKLRKSD